jgi:hypothetical protein
MAMDCRRVPVVARCNASTIFSGPREDHWWQHAALQPSAYEKTNAVKPKLRNSFNYLKDCTHNCHNRGMLKLELDTPPDQTMAWQGVERKQQQLLEGHAGSDSHWKSNSSIRSTRVLERGVQAIVDHNRPCDALTSLSMSCRTLKRFQGCTGLIWTADVWCPVRMLR